MSYQPSQKILEKYADVIVNFALNDCKGIKKGDVVYINVPENAKPFYVALRKAVLKSGGNPIMKYTPDSTSREFYELASDEQIKFFPSKFLKGLIDQIDHYVVIEADTNPHELEGINPKKIMLGQSAYKPYMKWRDEKENAGKFTWCIALYGTEEMAKEANLSLKEYWEQIIKACFLNYPSPVKKWKQVNAELDRLKNTLNKMKIEKVHIEAKGTDLIVGLGKNRRWMAGRGRNIPSFEVFISPDCRMTQGHITFNEPLYRYGSLIKDVYLEFDKGKVVKATAKKGQKVLQEIIRTKNANKIGEFSLTDSRLSKITKFMATTLFDENHGGRYGNSHLALGRAYQDSYPGNPSKVKKSKWQSMGYNDSVIHTDIVSSLPKIVTAYLPNGKTKVIYKDGKFLI